MSPINNNNPPSIKPIDAINQGFKLSVLDISIDGESNDQKDAEIITPAANPNIASIILLFIFLNKKTMLAPNAVTVQVNIVAINA